MKLQIKCAKCQQSKLEIEFNKDSSRKSGHSPYCKTCRIENNNKFYGENRDAVAKKVKISRSLNRDEYNKQNKEYRSKPENKLRLQKINNIKATLKKGGTNKSAILGCTGNEARLHLENGNFVDWPNFTRDFQLDYIKHPSQFSLEAMSQAFLIQNLVLKRRKFSLDL